MAIDVSQILRQVLREADGSLSVIPAGSSTAQILLMVLDSVNSALRVNVVFGESEEGSKVVVTDSNGNLETSDITTTELDYLEGVTSNIQDQLDSVGGGGTAGTTTFTPDGDIAATNVQSAIEEVRDDTDTKLSAKADSSDLTNYVAKLGDANTLLLCNFNTQVKDDTQKNHLRITGGNPLISASVKKYGDGSLYLGGSSYIDILNFENFQFGSSEFTIEAYIRIKAHSNPGYIVGQWKGGGGLSWVLRVNDDEKVNFYYSTDGSNGSNILYDTILSVDTWYHVAIVRSNTSDTIKLYVNGVEQDTVDSSSITIYNSDDIPRIGAMSETASNYFEGYVDCLRISNTARYTETFTPPTAEF